MELAVAPFDHSPPLYVKTATTTHEFAAVDASRRPVAQSAVRAQGPGATVRLAEVGRVAQVDEVGIGWWLELLVLWHQLTPCPAHKLLYNLYADTNTQ